MSQKSTLDTLITSSSAQAVLLMTGFFIALLCRVVIGGNDVSHSLLAGLVFAVLLISLSALGGIELRFSKRTIVVGILGTLLLLVVPVAKHLAGDSGSQPAGNYLFWALPVIAVAVAEEAFLRGTLLDVLTKWRGQKLAILVAAVLFALLHIPLYGWHVVPLDFIVGIWLGSLRFIGGSWIAPAITHVLADLLSWWV